MKFSAQEEYGLRCLLQIGSRGPGASLTIPEISRMEGLSQTNVAKLLMVLRKEGFVKSTRGQIGGYALARDPGEIDLSGLLSALGGRLFDDEFCSKHSGNQSVCAHDVECGLRSLWQTVQDAVDRSLAGRTLADLLPTNYLPKSGVSLLPLAPSGAVKA